MKKDQSEKTKRGAAGLARTTIGMSRILTPNKRLYNRKKEKHETKND